MSDLECSFRLLSSMSPRFKGSKSNKKIAAPQKLSLKKHFRKSIGLDSKPHSQNLLDSSVIIIRNSLSNESSPHNIQILNAPIIISSSSASDKSTTLDQGKLDEHIEIDKSNRQFDEYRVDLGTKYDEINSWLADNEKLDSYAEVPSFKHTSFSDTDNEICSPNNKTTEDKRQWRVVAIESKSGVDEAKVQSKTMFANQDVIDDSLTELNKTAENLLDELYGESWRKNKEMVLSRTEPKKTKKFAISMPKTERKLPNTKPKSPWLRRLNDVVDSDTETESTPSTKSKPTDYNNCNKRLSYSDSEDDSEPYIVRTNRKMVPTRKQFDINFSDSDSDSMGTRVRKKLAKKAKDLQSVKIVAKKMAEGIPRSKTPEKSKNASKTSEKLKRAVADLEGKSQTHSFLKSLSGCVPSWLCHEEAKQYKSNFKTKREELARKLFDLYNREIFDNAIPSDTELQWNDRIRGSAGFCYNKRITKSNGTILRSCRIVLANKVLDAADRLRDTLVHEMCHAATWLVNNVSDGHGPFWKSWAFKAMKVFPELPQIKRCHDYQINTKYTYKCVDCGYCIGRHSKSLDMERKRCGYCYGKFEVFINKVNKNGEKQCRPTTPKGKPTGFALFVKENYSSVKRDDLKHGDVMKLLGRQFSALKIAQNCK